MGCLGQDWEQEDELGDYCSNPGETRWATNSLSRDWKKERWILESREIELAERDDHQMQKYEESEELFFHETM